jgi:hypothetical protein
MFVDETQDFTQVMYVCVLFIWESWLVCD